MTVVTGLRKVGKTAWIERNCPGQTVVDLKALYPGPFVTTDMFDGIYRKAQELLQKGGVLEVTGYAENAHEHLARVIAEFPGEVDVVHIVPQDMEDLLNELRKHAHESRDGRWALRYAESVKEGKPGLRAPAEVFAGRVVAV